MRRLVLLAFFVLSCAAPQRPGTPALPPRPPTSALEGADAAEVQALSRRVEALRGLSFQAPVRAEQGDAALVDWLMQREIAKDRASGVYAREEAFLRAFGLIAPEDDLEAILRGVMGEQARGVYDHDEGVLFVIAGPSAVPSATAAQLERAGLGERSMVLLHELVHAAQDQHFGLSRFVEDGLTEDTALAYRALVEGDATYVMYEWMISTLTGRHLWDLPDLGGIRQMTEGLAAESNATLAAAPLYLRETLISGYLEGLLFVDALYRRGGWEAVDRAWAEPPVTTEQILHPEKYPQEGPVDVASPEPAALAEAGFRPVLRGRQGELGLRLFLRTLAEPSADAATRAALEAFLVSPGWGGDAFVVWTRPGARPAATWTLVFDSPEHAEGFLGAAGPLFAARPEFQLRRLGPERFAISTFLPEPLAEADPPVH